jgi:HPt (histidine-containing phosphotransfer) domain-containing protein
MILERNPAALENLHRAGGSPLVRQLIQLFLEHHPKRIAAAQEGEKAGDWKAVELAAHSMKSSAGNLGLTGLQQRAGGLEFLASQGGGSEAVGILQEITDAYPGLRSFLQNLQVGPSAA